MNNKVFKFFFILSLIFVQYFISTTLYYLSDGFIESVSLSLSDDLKMNNAFLMILLIATKNIIIIYMIMDDLFKKITTENTYIIVRYGSKKKYCKDELYSVIKNIAKINIFMIFIILIVNISIFKSFTFEFNLLYIIFLNFVYLTFKYMIFALITIILSFYFSRNISVILASIMYTIFTIFKNNKNLKIYSPLYYLDFYRSYHNIYEEIIRISIILFVSICLINIFLRIVDNLDIIDFRRGYE
nr:hypothetical protein [Helcococcus sueciensis]